MSGAPNAFAVRYARLALGAAFLSAVASRLGLWGDNDFAAFERYTAQVNSFMPAATIPFLARTATVLESLLGVALIAGVGLRSVALASATLLALFGTAMAISFGPKSPLDYSVFTASACAVLLGFTAPRREPPPRGAPDVLAPTPPGPVD
jgi:putative oxidoreductase